jgi:hypothetical protein
MWKKSTSLPPLILRPRPHLAPLRLPLHHRRSRPWREAEQRGPRREAEQWRRGSTVTGGAPWQRDPAKDGGGAEQGPAAAQGRSRTRLKLPSREKRWRKYGWPGPSPPAPPLVRVEEQNKGRPCRGPWSVPFFLSKSIKNDYYKSFILLKALLVML